MAYRPLPTRWLPPVDIGPAAVAAASVRGWIGCGASDDAAGADGTAATRCVAGLEATALVVSQDCTGWPVCTAHPANIGNATAIACHRMVIESLFKDRR